MRTIPLENSSLVAIVDDDQYERLVQYTWHLHSKGYVWRFFKDEYQMLHHAVLNIEPNNAVHVDHVNQYKLDNQKQNLRVIVRSQSMQNRTSWNPLYRGVIETRNGGYMARIQQNGKRKSLGVYGTAEKAAKVYDKKALELYGPSAATNFPKEEYV